MKTIKWQPEHFPIGTVVEVFVAGIHSEPMQRTVTSISINSEMSVIIITDTWDDGFEVWDAYNIEHVIRIISHGDGACKISLTSSILHLEEYIFGNNGSYELFLGNRVKSKTSYLVNCAKELLKLLVFRISGGLIYTRTIDIERLYTYLLDRGVIQIHPSSTWCYKTYVTANKRKLNKAIRQNINRFKIKRSVVQQSIYEAQKASYASYERDLDDDDLVTMSEDDYITFNDPKPGTDSAWDSLDAAEKAIFRNPDNFNQLGTSLHNLIANRDAIDHEIIPVAKIDK